MKDTTCDDVSIHMIISVQRIIETTARVIFEDELITRIPHKEKIKKSKRKNIGWFDEVLFDYDY